MGKNTKILIGLAAAGLIGFALWRNFGVKATGAVVLDSALGTPNDTSNEQKELIEKIKTLGTPKEGDLLQTSFGKNKFSNGVWTKYAEVWQGFADDKDHPVCPQGYKYVYFPIIKGFKEHIADARGGKCVENSVNVTVEDDRIHPAAKLNASGRGNIPCVYLSGSELISGLTSTYDPNICISSSGKGQVYSEHTQNWKSKI